MNEQTINKPKVPPSKKATAPDRWVIFSVMLIDGETRKGYYAGIHEIGVITEEEIYRRIHIAFAIELKDAVIFSNEEEAQENVDAIKKMMLHKRAEIN